MMKREYVKLIVFSESPLLGFFRYKDVFQIYPFASPNFPKSIHVTKAFPVALEFWIDESEKIKIENPIHPNVNSKDSFWQGNVWMKKQKEIVTLLSSLSNYKFYYYELPESSWSLPYDYENPEDANNEPSKWSMKLLTYPGLYKDLHITEFTNTEYKPVRFIRSNYYFYYSDSVNHPKARIDFPENIEKVIESYFMQKKKVQAAIFSACSLIYSGLDLSTKMKSLSFIAFVSSIETMIKIENPSNGKHCESCGQPVFSVKKKFMSYLKKYLENEELEPAIKEIYSQRSKIIHEGMLLLGDKHIDLSWPSKRTNEYVFSVAVMQYARKSLFNWLLKNPTV